MMRFKECLKQCAICLFNMILHPVKYVKYVKQKEQALLICLSCMHKDIGCPDVWDVDVLHRDVNELLDLLHEDQSSLDEFEFKHDMLWHLLLSKFMHLKMSREDVQYFVSMLSKLKTAVENAWAKNHGEDMKVAVFDLFIAWKLVMKDVID